VIALLRYVASDAFRSQRWMAPLVCFLALEAVIDAGTGPVLPTYAVSATALLFIATWLAVVVSNNEDPIQHTITAVTTGSAHRVRVAKLAVAYAGAVVLGAMALIAPPLVSSQRATFTEIASGAGAHVVTALAGVGFGALCSRPVIRRRAWAVLVAVVVCLADVVIPNCPPSQQLLVLFNQSRPHHLPLGVLALAAETLLLSTAAISTSLRVARARS